MKRKGFSILFAVVLVLSLSLVTAVPVGANGTVTNIDTSETFATIQAAIDDGDTLDGHTIEVGSGTYYEHVVVKKELTIRAANSPIVDGGGNGACFGIYKSAGLSNVTIEGFEIQNAKFGIWIYGAGASSTTYDNITLSNNDIHDHSENGILTTDVTVNGLTISGNTFNNSGIGISFDRAIVDSLTIDGNEITNGNVGLAFFSGSYSSVEVSNCYFEGNAWEHIDLGAWGKWPSLSGININTCQFLTGPWCAIWVESHFPDNDVVLRYNLFGVGYCGICNKSTHIVDAELNWWGHVSGPYDDKDMDGLSLVNTGGLGDIVGGTLWCGDVDYVDYEPWFGQGGWVTGGGWIDSPSGAYMPSDSSFVTEANVGVDWFINDTRWDGYVAFVEGPGNPPLRSGSLEMGTTASQDKAQLFNYDHIGTLLADIGGISYATYRDSSSTNPPAQYPAINIEVDYLGDGSSYTTLVWEPIYAYGQSNLAVDTWQTWDTMAPSQTGFQGGWWSTKTIPGVFAFNCFVDWETIVQNNPNAKIKYGFGVNVGSGWNGVFTGAIDALSLTVNDDTTTYDFEQMAPPTGKASFGFVAKYKKGADVPDGQTEFVFRAVGLNFHSSSYDWLVVTGSDYARFKGTGTINGAGEYKFMLWAGDGTGTDGADTFRIKIWEEDESGNETVIYDNGMDQAIGGGSIVVHTK